VNLIQFLLSLFRKSPEPLKSELVVTNDIVSRSPQPNITTTRKAIGGVAAASVIAAATVLIAQWEGLRLVAYDDGGGVWTICYGHTKGVKRGDVATKQQCLDWLQEDIAEHSAGMRQCATVPYKENEEIAHLSLVFNIGVSAYCGSSALRKHNAGEPDAGCDLMKLWIKDNGKTIPGLVSRRNAESIICKKGTQ
jgi:lysozyme